MVASLNYNEINDNPEINNNLKLFGNKWNWKKGKTKDQEKTKKITKYCIKHSFINNSKKNKETCAKEISTCDSNLEASYSTEIDKHGGCVFSIFLNER